MFFVIPEMQSRLFVMVLKKFPDHFKLKTVPWIPDVKLVYTPFIEIMIIFYNATQILQSVDRELVFHALSFRFLLFITMSIYVDTKNRCDGYRICSYLRSESGDKELTTWLSPYLKKSKTDKNKNPDSAVYKNSQIVLWSKMSEKKGKEPRRGQGGRGLKLIKKNKKNK